MRRKGSSDAHRIYANGSWHMRIDHAWGPMLKALGDIAYEQTQMQPAFERIAKQISLYSKRAFATQTSPDGQKWRDIRPTWREEKKRRGKGRGALVLSGKLKKATHRSKAVKVLTGDRLVYEVGAKYATFHQFGYLKGSGVSIGGPARQYLIWGEEMQALYIDEINRYGFERRNAILKGIHDAGLEKEAFELHKTARGGSSLRTRRKRSGR